MVTLTIPSALLVFDAMAWARSQMDLHLERGEEALRDGDVECAEEDFEVARELQGWLSEPRNPVRSVPLLALRQTVRPYQIRTPQIADYVSYLFTCHRPDLAGDIEFVLEVVSGSVTLYVNSTLRAQARYTGPDILGVVEQEPQFSLRVRTCAIAKEVQTCGRQACLDFPPNYRAVVAN
jgi:hypothetical protein